MCCSLTTPIIAFVLTPLQWLHNYMRWRLKSPASWLFTQPFIQAQIKEHIKAPRHWAFAGNSPVTSEFPQRASNAENVFIWWRHHVARTHPCVTSPVGHVPPGSPEVGLNTLSWHEDPGPRFHPRHPDPPRGRHGRSRKRTPHWLSITIVREVGAKWHS